MSVIFTAMEKFFQEDGWPIQPIGDASAFSMTARGNNGQWPCIAQADEESGVFLFYSAAPLDVPPDRREAVALLLTRANYGTISGAFELSLDDGDLRFRTSLRLTDIPDGVLETGNVLRHLIQNAVYVNVQMMDQYLPAIYGVVYHAVTPEQAIAQVE